VVRLSGEQRAVERIGRRRDQVDDEEVSDHGTAPRFRLLPTALRNAALWSTHERRIARATRRPSNLRLYGRTETGEPASPTA
jgi:hypothetical protein